MKLAIITQIIVHLAILHHFLTNYRYNLIKKHILANHNVIKVIFMKIVYKNANNVIMIFAKLVIINKIHAQNVQIQLYFCILILAKIYVPKVIIFKNKSV